MSTIRTRYAPSPTGPLHVGGARTALFNRLFAEKNGGKFIVRIENTDLERSDPQYEKDVMDGLKWLGLGGDENIEKDGPYAPYRQSERTGMYKKYIRKLLSEKKAFYCFHSERELEEEKQKSLEAKKPPLHLCEYREMDSQEAGILAKTKEDHIIRFKTPAGRKITFDDLIREEVSFDSDLIGDFSIAKKIDAPLYNFAVAVDDFEMKISHVIRGEDHIANTPKQMLLIEALGFPQPHYAHLPLLLGADRSKLSKRHRATSVTEYREQGYLPEALFNFMALLGWSPGDDREILSKEELIKEFSLERVQKSGAIFDITKLDWMNGEYIRRKPLKELVELVMPFLEKSGLLQLANRKSQIVNEYIEKIVALEQPRLKKLSEVGERVDYFFREPQYDKELLRWKSMTDQEIAESLKFSEKIIFNFQLSIFKQQIEEKFISEIGTGDKGKILWPLRVALSGKNASPGPFEILEILGKERALARLIYAKKLILETV